MAARLSRRSTAAAVCMRSLVHRTTTPRCRLHARLARPPRAAAHHVHISCSGDHGMRWRRRHVLPGVQQGGCAASRCFTRARTGTPARRCVAAQPYDVPPPLASLLRRAAAAAGTQAVFLCILLPQPARRRSCAQRASPTPEALPPKTANAKERPLERRHKCRRLDTIVLMPASLGRAAADSRSLRSRKPHPRVGRLSRPVLVSAAPCDHQIVVGLSPFAPALRGCFGGDNFGGCTPLSHHPEPSSGCRASARCCMKTTSPGIG